MFFLLVTLDLILYVGAGMLFFADDRTPSQLTSAIVCLAAAFLLSICILLFYRKKVERNCADCTPDCLALDCVDCDKDGLECCGLDCNL